MKTWLGTAGWSYFPDWVGPFYPPGTPPSDALARYVEAFSFVEIDSSFYAAPAPPTVERWAEVMPHEFRVSVKAPRELVQDTGLRPPEPPSPISSNASWPPFTRASPRGRADASVVRPRSRDGDRPPRFRRPRRRSPHSPSSCATRRGWTTLLSLFATTAWCGSATTSLPCPTALRAASITVYVRLLGPHRGLDGKAEVQRPQPEGRGFWVERLVEWDDGGWTRHTSSSTTTTRATLPDGARPGGRPPGPHT